jgi:lysophospholipase L1-like esterase
VEFGWNDHWPSPVNRPDDEVRVPSRSVFAFQQYLVRLRLYRLLRTMLLPAPDPRLLRVPLESYRRNLTRIADQVRWHGGQVVFITAPYLGDSFGWVGLHRRYIEATIMLAAELRVALVDLSGIFARRPELFLDPRNDPCHINSGGAEIVAKEVATTIVEKGLLP